MVEHTRNPSVPLIEGSDAKLHAIELLRAIKNDCDDDGFPQRPNAVVDLRALKTNDVELNKAINAVANILEQAEQSEDYCAFINE